MAYRIFCERLLAGEPITIYGDGSQTRGNTYVLDCVDATVAALGAGTLGRAYNVGGGEALSLADALAMLAAALGVEPVVEHEPARTGDQRHTMADISRARTDLAWVPSTSAAEGLVAEARWVSGLTRRAGEVPRGD
jgi:nucleoside-diphosphate-sugar epimerase